MSRPNPGYRGWLTPERLRAYALIWFLMFLLTAALWQIRQPQLHDGPLARDFIAFWAAAQMAGAGFAEAAYTPARIHAVEMSALAYSGLFPWFYPPPAFLPLLALFQIPYYPAFLAFSLGGLLSAALALWLLSRRTLTVCLGLLFPATVVTLIYGQNGLWLTGLLGCALAILPRQPRMAGLLLGMLVIKPQLFLLIPLGLIMLRAWPALLTAVLSAMLWCLLSLTLFGHEAWMAFVDALALARHYLDSGLLPWPQMASAFSSARWLGLGTMAGQIIQGAWALTALLLLASLLRRRPGNDLLWAGILSASLMLSPFIYQYDLVLLLLPLLAICRHAGHHGWLAGDIELIVLCAVLPLWAYLGNQPVMTLAPALTLLMAWRHSRRADHDYKKPSDGYAKTHPASIH